MLRLGMALLGVLLLISCGGGGSGAPSAAAPAVPKTPPLPAKPFVDATSASGIAFDIGYRIQPPPDLVSRFSTSGVAAGDYDGDGDVDLFIVRGDIGANLLFRNDGAGVFRDVAQVAGVAFTATPAENYRHTGPAFADMDGDGDLDLFIGSVYRDPPFIFANNGDGTFSDVTAGSGLDGMQAAFNISASFGDYDLDGDLDMFVTHWGTRRDMQSPGDTEHLWRNDSAGGTIRFTSVSESAGIAPSILTLPDVLAAVRDHDYTFAASFVRLDGDLYPDIVVSADNNNSMVFMNNGDGTFRNATDVTVITDGFGMGSALGDYDDDGDLDWFVSAIFETSSVGGMRNARDGNRLYRNEGGIFSDVTREAGVLDGSWGWGACFLDLDNDGDLDLYHTNGWNEGFENDASRAFVADGSGRFHDEAERLGLDGTEQGRGVVCADFDNDGDIDILELHRAQTVAATLWRNDHSGNNFVRVRLNGSPPNTQAAGARIYATVGARTMLREIVIGNNFLSQNPTLQIFGLGKSTQIDELRVEWPDGTESRFSGVSAGRTLVIDQPL